MKVKRTDVAKEAGVSVATVSYVLNGTKKFSPLVESRVREIAKKLGYIPNKSAQSLAGGKTKTIILMTEDISNAYQLEVVRGLQEEALKNDYFVYMCDIRGDVNNYLDHIIARNFDGAFISTAPNSLTDKHLQKIIDSGICVLADYMRNTYLPDASYIMSDMFNGFEQAVKHLADLGHTNIGYVSAFDEACYYDFRLLAFKTAMRKILNNTSPIIEYGSSLIYETSEKEGGRIMGNMLKNHPEVTAIICTNDLMAIGSAKVILKAGKRIPEDISVIGIDNIKECESFNPPLTTISQDAINYGKKIFEILYKDIVYHITGKYIVPMKLIVRESTCKIK